MEFRITSYFLGYFKLSLQFVKILWAGGIRIRLKIPVISWDKEGI